MNIFEGVDQLIRDSELRKEVSEDLGKSYPYFLNNFDFKLDPKGYYKEKKDMMKAVDRALEITGIGRDRVEAILARKSEGSDKFCDFMNDFSIPFEEKKKYLAEQGIKSNKILEDLFEIAYPVYCVMRSKGYSRGDLIR